MTMATRPPIGSTSACQAAFWARCNLGATTPEGYGDYYAWGETETKEVYDWSIYKYCTFYFSTGILKRPFARYAYYNV